MPGDDWDESAMSAAKADDVERYSEEVRPGQGDEDGRRARRPRDRVLHRRAAAARLRKVVLKIRRRKFKRSLQGRRDPHHPSPVPLRRERISAERQALPLA